LLLLCYTIRRMHICTYMYIYIYVYIYINISIYLCIYIYIYMYIYICICIYIYKYIYIFMYIYMYICTFEYLYIYRCVYIYMYMNKCEKRYRYTFHTYCMHVYIFIYSFIHTYTHKHIASVIFKVQPGDELLLLCSTMRRMIMKKKYHRQIMSNFENFHISQNIKINSEKVVKNEKNEKNYQKEDNYEIDTIISASKWAQLLSYGINSSPHTYTFKLEILEPYRILCAIEPAIVAYTGTYLFSVYIIDVIILILFCTYAFLAGSVRMRKSFVFSPFLLIIFK
jgi:hypothetical protein